MRHWPATLNVHERLLFCFSAAVIIDPYLVYRRRRRRIILALLAFLAFVVPLCIVIILVTA